MNQHEIMQPRLSARQIAIITTVAMAALVLGFAPFAAADHTIPGNGNEDWDTNFVHCNNGHSNDNGHGPKNGDHGHEVFKTLPNGKTITVCFNSAPGANVP